MEVEGSEIRKCSVCGKELPETQSNFYFRDKEKGTFRTECIVCHKKRLPEKEKHFVIYRIKSPSGKVYIGKDEYFPQRMNNHLHISENPKKSEYNSPVHRAIRKYGWYNMIVEAVDQRSKTVEELKRREKIWIWLSNSKKKGYNQTLGGEGTVGFRHSKETKKALSIQKTGGKLTKEHKKKIGLAGTGKKHSEESKRKIGNASRGKVLSDETKELISKARSGIPLSEEHKEKITRGLDLYRGIPIPEERRLKIKESHLKSEFELIDPEGVPHIVVDLATFALSHNLYTQHLYKVLNGKRKHHKGWTGRYLVKEGQPVH